MCTLFEQFLHQDHSNIILNYALCAGALHPYEKHEAHALFHFIEATRTKFLKHVQELYRESTFLLPPLLSRDGCLNLNIDVTKRVTRDSAEPDADTLGA
jgi:hypothetical protein